MRGLAASHAVILGVIAVVIILIVIASIAKHLGKGWRWLLSLLAIALAAYLFITDLLIH